VINSLSVISNVYSVWFQEIYAVSFIQILDVFTVKHKTDILDTHLREKYTYIGRRMAV